MTACICVHSLAELHIATVGGMTLLKFVKRASNETCADIQLANCLANDAHESTGHIFLELAQYLASLSKYFEQ